MINKDEHLRVFLHKLSNTNNDLPLISLDKETGKILLKYNKRFIQVMYIFELKELLYKLQQKHDLLPNEILKTFHRDLPLVTNAIKNYKIQELENIDLGKEIQILVNNNIDNCLKKEFTLVCRNSIEKEYFLISNKHMNFNINSNINIYNVIDDIFGSFQQNQQKKTLEFTKLFIQYYGVINPDLGNITIKFNKDTKLGIIYYLFQKLCYDYKIKALKQNDSLKLKFSDEITKLNVLMQSDCLANFEFILRCIQNFTFNKFIQDNFKILDLYTLETTSKVLMFLYKKIDAIIKCFSKNNFSFTFIQDHNKHKSIENIISPTFNFLKNNQQEPKSLKVNEINKIIQPYQYDNEFKDLSIISKKLAALNPQEKIKRKHSMIERILPGDVIKQSLEKIAYAKDHNIHIPKKLRLCEW